MRKGSEVMTKQLARPRFRVASTTQRAVTGQANKNARKHRHAGNTSTRLPKPLNICHTRRRYRTQDQYANVIPQPTPRWPRRCSKHGPKLQCHASALYGLSTTRSCSRSSRATALRSWYGSMPLNEHKSKALTRANRLWRRIQYQRATTFWPTCSRWRKTNRAATDSSSRPPATSLPDLGDAPRHG